MKINYSEIYNLCSFETVFYKGMNYWNNGCVKKVSKTKINSSEEYIEAKVKGGHTYNVTIWCENEKVSRTLCDCSAFEKTDGVCKHIASVLFSLVPRDTEMTQLSSGTKKSTSSAFANSIIRSYKLSLEKNLPKDEKAELIPTLHIKSQRETAVEFSIAFPKSYVIKDLCAFSENVASGKEATYGKDLCFVHSPQNFSKDAEKYLELISASAEENQVFNKLFNKYSYLSPLKARSLELSPYLLDRLMELSLDKELSVEIGGKTDSYFVSRKNPHLAFTFSEAGGGHILVKCEKCVCFFGEKHLYIIRGREIYITDEEYKEKMQGMFSSASVFNPPESFTLSFEDMFFFYNNIIPEISAYSSIIPENIDLSRFDMPTPEVKFYLDLDPSGDLFAKCEILYGDRKINPFSKDNESPLRDAVLEHNIKATLFKYFTAFDEDAGIFSVGEEEDGFFEFADFGIEDLKVFGEVFASDSFRRLSIRKAPKISVGLSINSGILELEFFSDEFDLKELKSILKSHKEKKKYHRLKNGSFISLEDESLSKILDVQSALNIQDIGGGKPIALPKHRALYLDRIFGKESVSRNADFRSLIRNINSAEMGDWEIPKSLKNILRPYQKHGFRWLRAMDSYGFGGILADDMGLGKTLQVITLLLSEKEAGGEGEKSLIVCPASLIYNWENEISRFAPSLSTLVLSGTIAEREELFKTLDSFDVIITSYDLLKRDKDLYSEKTFRFLIIDEAQYIKNHSTQSAKAVKTIKAKSRFALTGTPVENRLSELWSIFDFLMPGFLFSYNKFRKDFETPCIKLGDQRCLEKIKNMVTPFILRRLKGEVLKELPEKTEHIFYSKMEEAQRKIYSANVKVLKDTVEKNTKSSLREDAVMILSLLTKLRQLCCDPSLCYENYKGESCKLESCISLVKEAVQGGHKTLIFSQFTSMLEIIEERLEEEGIPFYTLTGQTPKERRISLVKSFEKDDVPVFLISLKAGGTGLNLTSADVVIHFDPWWNISAQNQATDRTHRIGQKNPVTVYKLIAKGTVEEKILDLQKSKQHLADSIITENSVNIADMTKEELLSILEEGE